MSEKKLKCTLDKTGSVDPCWLVSEATDSIYRRGGGLQRVSLISGIGGGKEVVRNTYKLIAGRFKKGVVLNFCPFCGADIQRPKP